ncbi:DUF1836 domain-containing protein [Anaerobacillus isosaccharinicus]|uniref:DUF1836 domain-containing protein n=1 Tax=Anaerobacillus isosaccharinicus TaxID=1532552 RepID=A0A1S2LMB6_9BACI|nr:DUF1836 domain-containing protein [Anaerobacillus isosaccharinicus]MBA5586267.1 DUF1836 domain-containing protein [Anaerobacillus isosaccharinicus]QOY35481.1 DUF1836 domain-containing protein [Anaerobacillus isosaccharinicus]
MKTSTELIEQLGLDKAITLDHIPNIDLYMDQIIQLFENTYGETKRNDTDKVMTKTMINNYAKAKVFFPIKNKKYSKEHLILISMIYHLKGALSINDIKTTLEGINEKTVNKDIDLEAFYNSYLQLSEKNVESFKAEVNFQASEVKKEVANLEVEDQDYLEKVMLISTLVSTSNLYRKLAEKLIDELESKEV